MQNKIKLTGVRNIPWEGDSPDYNKDYALTLIVSPEGEYTPAKQGEEVEAKTFHFKVIRPEMLQQIGKKTEEKIEKGFTKSQVLRFKINAMLKRKGEEQTEEEYGKVMNKLGDIIDGKYN